jgi:peptidoglycan/xylan/chitin deacetylase (PgdA/CDA1 family)
MPERNSSMISRAKIYLKYAFAVAFYYSGAGWLLSKIKCRRNRPWPIVLMYHRAIEPKDAVGLQSGMYVYKDVFEKQIEYLSSHYQIRKVSEFASGIERSEVYSSNDLLITIDDGWRDNYTNAFPILKKHDAGAAIFLAVNFIGTKYRFWFQEISSILSQPDIKLDQLAKAVRTVLKKYPDSLIARELLNENIASLLADRDRFIEILKYFDAKITLEIADEARKLSGNNPIKDSEERQILNWDEIRVMEQSGIEFGSHGLTHSLLDSLDTAEAFRELVESKKTIEENLEKSVCSFTYPNGNYNGDIETLVEKSGYACAFIVGKNPANQNRPDRFAIDRTGVHNGVSTNPVGKYSRAMFAWHLYRNT